MALLCSLALGALAVIFLPYLAFHIVLSLLPPRNLRRAYDAQWGLVTGSSSGAHPLGFVHTQTMCFRGAVRGVIGTVATLALSELLTLTSSEHATQA
jgi:hypothetical protein